MEYNNHDLNNEIIKLQNSLNELRTSHESLLETSMENKRVNDNLNEMIVTLKNELNRMDDVINDQKKENERLARTNSDLREGNEKLLNEIVNLKKENEN